MESTQWGMKPRELSPSPLRSGGEGRGEEAPSGLRETNPSPPALSPLRCAGRGRRPPLFAPKIGLPPRRKHWIRGTALLLLAGSLAGHAADLARPDFFETLVNPPCSHCVDESKRRSADLRSDDRVVAWVRGKYDGGAVPLRFFLVPYRVISDTYGVFVYDADSGFVRGFEPSLDFTFYGWHNGVMSIRHKDGTIYSALSGIAFEGPKRGAALKPIPTLETDWGYWLRNYPGTVAYQMFDRYQAHDLPAAATDEAVKTRPPPDGRLQADERVIGLAIGGVARAYPISRLAHEKVIRDKMGNQELVVLWQPLTKTAAIYAPGMENETVPSRLKIEWNEQIADAPFMDRETFSHWNVEGRSVAGPLRGQTLVWLPAIQCKWVAWSAEYPRTEVFSSAGSLVAEPETPLVARLIEGERLDWDHLLKVAGSISEMDPHGGTLAISTTNQTPLKLFLEPQSEIYVRGGWGQITEFTPGQRVYVMGKTNRAGNLVAHAVADEISIQAMSQPPTLVESDATAGRYVFGLPSSKRWTIYSRANSQAGCSPQTLQPGSVCYFNSAEAGAERVFLCFFDQKSYDAQLRARREAQLNHARSEGLAATVLGGGNASGSVDFLVHRSDSLFARTLKAGDRVAIPAPSPDPPRSFAIREVLPDYSRTRLRIEMGAERANTLEPGQEVRLQFALPPEIDWEKPMDLGRFPGRQARIDYFLSTVYCTCGMMGTACAGHWNTLAACKLHGCGMPDLVSRLVGPWIDAGRSDREILAALLQREGPWLLKQHQLAPPLLQ